MSMVIKKKKHSTLRVKSVKNISEGFSTYKIFHFFFLLYFKVKYKGKPR